MSRSDRLRRVVILCRAFTWNLAYYRVGRRKEYSHLFDKPTTAGGNFWRATNSNNIDICVLEWCKLFADENGKHYWGKIVTAPALFKAGLLHHLGLDETGLQKEIGIMRQYRDKFLAHLDSDNIMNIPALDVAKKTVWFYHDHVVNREAQNGDLNGIDGALETAYGEFETEATGVYQRNS
jgi:hypothetical protein